MFSAPVVVAVCLTCYGLALLLPAVSLFAPHTASSGIPGWMAFWFGLCAFVVPAPVDLERVLVMVNWLANPAIWVGLVSAWWGWWRSAAGCGVAGVLLSLAVLLLPRYRDGLVGQPGYWLWVATAALLCVGSCLLVRSKRERAAVSPEQTAFRDLGSHLGTRR